VARLTIDERYDDDIAQRMLAFSVAARVWG
jgi:hypothetical protein